MWAGVGAKGRDMGGLLAYLYGPGSRNEHTNQHAIASSHDDLMVQAFQGSLTSGEAREMGSVLVRNFESVHVRERALALVGGGDEVSQAGANGGVADVDRNTDVPPHVFHAFLSLHADDGQLTDQQWNTVAHDYVREMFGKQSESLEWVAVRHGLSEKGNDHIHIALNRVDADGNYANVHRDYERSRKAARTLEKRHPFLTKMHTLDGERTSGRYTRAEREIYAGRSRGQLPSQQKARIVRAAAGMAQNERQFLALMSDKGLKVSPRWGRGSREEVVGFSVKLANDPKDVYVGGGRLAGDLTLPKLRERWQQSEADQREALPIWRGLQAPPQRGDMSQVDVNRALRDAARFMGEWSKKLDTIPHRDVMQWKQEAGRLAGVFGQLGQDNDTKLGANMRWLSRRYERMAQHENRPVHRGRGDAENAMRQVDIAMSAPQMIAPGSTAGILSAGLQAGQAIERANRAAEDSAGVQGELAALQARRESIRRRFEEVAQIGREDQQAAQSASSYPKQVRGWLAPEENQPQRGHERE